MIRGVAGVRWWLALALLVAMTCGLGGGAGVALAARKRVVFLGVDGPQAGRASSMIERLLSKKFTLVSVKAYVRARKRLRAKGSDRDLAKVLQDVGADALVSGSIRRKGARWVLRVSVKNGTNGKTVGSASDVMRRPADAASSRGAIAGRLYAAVERSGGKVVVLAAGKKVKPQPEPEPDGEDGAGAGGDDDEPVPDEPPRGKGGKKGREVVARGGDGGDGGGDDGGGGGRKGRGARDGDGDGDDGGDGGDGGDGAGAAGGDGDGSARKRRDDDDDGDRVDLAGRSRGLPPSAIRLSAGVTFIGRDFAFANSRTELPSYKGVPTPAGLIEAELYPLALAGGGPMRRLGLGLVLERVITMHTEDNDAPGLEIPTRRQRLEFDVRYRHQLGDRASRTAFTGRAGYGNHLFAIDDYDPDRDGNTNRKLPNVSYRYALLGAGVRIPIVRTLFQTYVDAAYLLVLDTGEIGKATSFGGGFVGGLDGELGLDIRPTRSLTLRIGGRYTRFFYDFDNSGRLADQNNDGKQDVGGALDQYFGGFVSLGYLR
ncbi:MAG: hypothetical protein IT370_27755 [Deltaproteobacteria bacterium]|nr:hypothetical protein [Deltaproteobacteria bacterium]